LLRVELSETNEAFDAGKAIDDTRVFVV